jgi:hypothetical protein
MDPSDVKLIRAQTVPTDPRPPRLLDRVREAIRARHYPPLIRDAPSGSGL